jgi:hypothetical protein
MNVFVQRYLAGQLAIASDEVKSAVADPQQLPLLAGIRRVVFVSSSVFFEETPFLSQLYPTQDQTRATREYVMQTGGSMAAMVDQPLYQAIEHAVRGERIPLREVEPELLSQHGVLARLDRTWYLLGDEWFMADQGLDLGISLQAVTRKEEERGAYILYLAQKQPKRLLAVFAISRSLKSEANAAISALEENDIEVVFLTNLKTSMAKGIAKQLSLPLVHGELSLSERKMIIATLNHPTDTLFVCQNREQVRWLPEGANIAAFGGPGSLQAVRVLQLITLNQIPQSIIFARSVLAKARQRFFWCKI